MIATAEHPNDVAEALTGRSYLSVSAVKTFMKCPLAYKAKYIDKLPENSVSSALAFGRSIHASVEIWFRARLEGMTEPTTDDLLSEFWDEWKACEQEKEVRLGKNEDVAKVADTAARVIEAFTDSDAARPEGSIVGIEEELRAPLLANVPDVLGRLDLAVESDDVIKVVDFKTAKSKWSDAQRQDAELQGVIYAELARTFAGAKPVQVEFIVVTKTKTPSVTIERVDTSDRAIERGKAIMAAVWQAIQTGNFFPSPSIMSCPTCPYRSRCEAWTG